LVAYFDEIEQQSLQDINQVPPMFEDIEILKPSQFYIDANVKECVDPTIQ
jgi:hypothetical protein